MRGNIVENSIYEDSEDASKVKYQFIPLYENEMCQLNYSLFITEEFSIIFNLYFQLPQHTHTHTKCPQPTT